ncbi:hypothetical protein N7495_008603 [Penicillium taxi]|uniref:uncharacterized protein n=1 Tax=Penicillium taxi TaxID=168475 RepID=UPI00254594E1|nr:uncharacterized protein N7495_008603 [Penicillium taxi]KAJ5888562.1 hypothetical protein N7495_008603 [Penicillium taxi]
MASSRSPLPFEEAKSVMSTVMPMISHVYHRPRTQRAKTIAYSAIFFFVVIVIYMTAPKSIEPDYWSTFPSQHPFPERPEDAQVVLPQRPDITLNDSLPHDLEKKNPYLHVLLPVQRSSRGLCRTIASGSILHYPPPTLIGYGIESHGTEFSRMVTQLTRVRDYLNESKGVKDGDFILLVDADDVFFQLPPQILVNRFQNIIRSNNARLLQKYGYATVPGPDPGSPPVKVQKYTQRVLFGASKLCHSLSGDPGCTAVPESSLPPDVYGWKTDSQSDGIKNRPRWLNSGAVMGQAADLRLIFNEVLHQIEKHTKEDPEYHILTHIFGRQEVVREIERLRTVNGAKEWFYQLLGISDKTNLAGLKVRLETGRRYEYGIGVDYESQMFFNQFLSRKDVDWLDYSNISKSSSLQGQFGVPRERRLLLPSDIAALPSPFNQSLLAREETASPEWNSTLDKFPNPDNHTWNHIPLMMNPYSASVPVLAHLNGDPKLRNAWWEEMWFFPWARALMRRNVRDAQGFDAAQSALLGGQDWWDMRGGRGGLWTDDKNWITFSEACEGHERDLFDDDLGPWNKENGDPDAPVYNRWGHLVYGKEEIKNE